ncbi:MAG: DNA-3-methyladenine glycosylase [Waddliaceae bacterium]
MTTLPLEFYRQQDVVQLGQDLLGKFLMADFGQGPIGGMITETEAYRGPEDRASHAYNNRKTKRNQVMYRKGGVCYVYLCYGIHHLFNVVTNTADIPHAILIRALAPFKGDKLLTALHRLNGPGVLTKALGIRTAHSGLALDRPPIWIEDRQVDIPSQDIESKPRVGIDYAGPDASLLWRFLVSNNFLSGMEQT